MIAHIFGVVTEKFSSAMVIDVHGIGYEVSVAAGDFDNTTLGQEVKIYTHHYVREQSEELFGFSSLATKKIFEMLITVQGVGPKAALAILGLGDSESVRNAIANSDVSFIQQAPGIGKKTAERVVVDLSDKVGLPTRYGRKDGLHQTEPNMTDDALEALVALGYSLADATKALEKVDSSLSTAARVTEALKHQSID